MDGWSTTWKPRIKPTKFSSDVVKKSMDITLQRDVITKSYWYQESYYLQAIHLLSSEPLAKSLEPLQSKVNLQLPHNGVAKSEQAVAERQSLSSHLRSFGLAGAKLSLRLLLLHMLGTTFTQQAQKKTFITAVEDAFQ